MMQTHAPNKKCYFYECNGTTMFAALLLEHDVLFTRFGAHSFGTVFKH
jgi:hypothetical protein